MTHPRPFDISALMVQPPAQQAAQPAELLAIKSRQNYINHVALVLDASASMGYHRDKLVEVVDAQVAHLAQLSKDLDQETRVTIYMFDNQVHCLVYDKDVLRLPSIKDLYRTRGMTALIDAAMTSLNDLAHTWEGYGDHSFLVYVLTDGQENASRTYGISEFRHRLAHLPDHWTVAALVPDVMAKREAQNYGFPTANIAVWDASTEKGFEEAGSVLRASTTSYMTSRSTGVRGTKTLFSVDASSLTDAAVKAAKLTPMDPSEYVLIPVVSDVAIKDMVDQCTTGYRIGNAFYQLNSGRKPKGRAGVIVQGNKQIVVVEKATNKAYTGSQARALVGLPDYEVTVDPTKMDTEYDVFVQSTSLNRKLFAGTKLLLLT